MTKPFDSTPGKPFDSTPADINKLDELCTNLVGAATLYERHHNDLDGKAVEDYIRQIRQLLLEARIDELEKLRTIARVHYKDSPLLVTILEITGHRLDELEALKEAEK